jgi:hypothetical protein
MGSHPTLNGEAPQIRRLWSAPGVTESVICPGEDHLDAGCHIRPLPTASDPSAILRGRKVALCQRLAQASSHVLSRDGTGLSRDDPLVNQC